jgi:hypothetical protein
MTVVEWALFASQEGRHTATLSWRSLAASRPAQARESAGAMGFALTREELSRLDQVTRS